MLWICILFPDCKIQVSLDNEASAYLCGTKAGAELTGVGGSDNLKLYLNKVMGGKQVKI